MCLDYSSRPSSPVTAQEHLGKEGLDTDRPAQLLPVSQAPGMRPPPLHHCPVCPCETEGKREAEEGRGG